jgi:hypothetical protein
MKKTLLIAITLIWAQHIWAKKIPGYMGLKCSVQYQGGISPQWNNLSQSYIPYYSHNVQVGYVVSRKYEVGLQYTRIDYGSNFPRSIEDYNTGNTVSMDYRKFTGNNVMAYIKFFRARKGFIAPLGRYYLLGLTYQNSIDKFHVTQDDYSAVPVPNYTVVKSHDIALTVGVGRNIILFNRMLLSIEGDVNIPISTGIRAALSNNTIGDFDGIHTSPNVYKHINAFDVLLVNLVQIKIGLGALVF